MYRRHGHRVSARGDGAGNFKFEDVMAQRDEAGAEPGGPFPGIGDMDPRSWASVPSMGGLFSWPMDVIFMTGSNRV